MPGMDAFSVAMINGDSYNSDTIMPTPESPTVAELLSVGGWLQIGAALPLPTITAGNCPVAPPPVAPPPVSAPINLSFWGMFGLFGFIITIASFFRKHIFRGEG
ncbi:hypothetical protein QUF61_02355 [Candidatus Venteria ishoeyi]|uniref:hypothetical protein n=1 Tax=Candidatus Venteria ishoeyi TaxID=1899563 RepID=UPI0025A4E9C1|nr:hypothetical protein [Candidatus Venteria ishoeyi]MDM8545314.1 hypothetical protein [Candidatus Venteria ishoeyi]